MASMQFNGPVWRLLPMSLAKTPSIAAQAPVGRFHHSGQVAAYASLSVEGVEVAMRRYLEAVSYTHLTLPTRLLV